MTTESPVKKSEWQTYGKSILLSNPPRTPTPRPNHVSERGNRIYIIELNTDYLNWQFGR